MLYDHLLLVSSSPQRHKIIETMGIPYEIIFNDFQETYPSQGSPSQQTLRLSHEKMSHYLTLNQPCSLPALTADTLIGFRGRLLGKPQNEKEAWSFYKELSGKVHSVVTAFSLFVPHKNTFFSAFEKTAVRLIPWDFNIYTQYLKTQEWQTSAAGYQAQGAGSVLISHIRGSLTNVVGLPSHRVYGMLRKYSCFFP